VWVFILIFYCGTAHSETSDLSVSLAGLKKFHPGDNPIWSSPEYDDSRWRLINVPGSWRSQGVSPENGMGWYRIHFTAPETLKGMDLGVSLGIIGNADETFLNGLKIGGEGVVGHRFIEATGVERLYRLPAGLLRHNRVNILAVRVMNTYSRGGIYEGRPEIADYNRLQSDKLSRDFARKAEEIGLFSIFFIFFVSCILLYVAGIREHEYIYFGVFILIQLSSYVLESLVFYETGLKTSISQGIIGTLLGLVPASLLCFLSSFLKHEFTFPIKTLILYSVVVSLALLLFSNYSFGTYTLLSFLWAFGAMLICAAGIYIAIRAYTKKRHESGPMLLGVMGLVIAGLLETMNTLGIIYLSGYYYVTFPYLFFMMCVVYALVVRFLRFRSMTMALSGRILTAHEEERKRLARDLHDGLGQSLLAVKFNLQRVNRELKDRLIDGVIEELSCSMNELRDISAGLRPPFLEEMGIGAALKSFGKKFSEKTGTKVSVSSDTARRPVALIEENLFRIFQEALSNVAKHSGAKTVKVSFQIFGDRAVMEIEDDGRGFDYFKALSEGRGIGLSTINERVELVGGHLRVKSRSGKGTILSIEVSVK